MKEYASGMSTSDFFVSTCAVIFERNSQADEAGLAFKQLMPMLIDGMPDELKGMEVLSLIDFVGD